MTPTLSPIPEGLTVTRDADRRRIVALLIEAAGACGATATVDYGDREATVRAEAAGLTGMVWLYARAVRRGRGSPGYCIHWSAQPGGRLLRPGYLPGVNPHHYGKATSSCNDLASLRDELMRGLQGAISGEAWQPTAAEAKRPELEPARYGRSGRGTVLCEMRDDFAGGLMCDASGCIDAPQYIATGSVRSGDVWMSTTRARP